MISSGTNNLAKNATFSYVQFWPFGFCLNVGRSKHFLQAQPKFLLRKKKLHLEQIDRGSDWSEMDKASDTLNLLEQKVIRPLSRHSLQDDHSSGGHKDAWPAKDVKSSRRWCFARCAQNVDSHWFRRELLWGRDNNSGQAIKFCKCELCHMTSFYYKLNAAIRNSMLLCWPQ